MTRAELTSIVGDITCAPYAIEHGELGVGWFIRITFAAAGAKQNGRKWYVSPHATESEVVQTALKAVLTAAEHELREAFTYHGAALYSPHFDVHALIDAARSRKPDVRTPQDAIRVLLDAK